LVRLRDSGAIELVAIAVDTNARSVFAAPRPESSITHLEVNDLNFEFVFPEYLGQDGSGEKGFQGVNREVERSFFLPCGRECPSLSRLSEPVVDTSLCPGK
jgi:hypothetical protein